MGIVKDMKLYGFYKRFLQIERENKTMTIKVPQLVTLFISLSATIGLPTNATNWVHGHQTIYLAIVAVALMLHSLMPSVFSAPSDSDQTSSGFKSGMIILALMIGLSTSAKAQTVPAANASPDNAANIYAAGMSYSVNAKPAIAGTALYAHLLSDVTNTYAFTVIDALPNTVKPFTVSTNIGAGIAQKVATWNGVNIYLPTAAGISFNGTNTGWQWNGGAMAAFKLKGSYYIMPSVRFLKSSVGNGTGYQPIIGIMFGWGN
jgi:hypothetical protein